METSLIRINQAGDTDLASVSRYYSSQLMTYVTNVLQVIPRSVFSIMANIALQQTTHIPQLPARLDKDKILNYTKFDVRFEVILFMSVF